MPERRKVDTGDFRLCEAIIRGVIVRDGPEHKQSAAGTARWMEATILVDLYDGRQRAERERPAFVRIKAFEKSATEAYRMLEGCERLDKIAVAGQLQIHVWDSNGERRESFELLADYILRGQQFDPLSKLLADPNGEDEVENARRGDEEPPVDEPPPYDDGESEDSEIPF